PTHAPQLRRNDSGQPQYDGFRIDMHRGVFREAHALDYLWGIGQVKEVRIGLVVEVPILRWKYAVSIFVILQDGSRTSLARSRWISQQFQHIIRHVLKPAQHHRCAGQHDTRGVEILDGYEGRRWPGRRQHARGVADVEGYGHGPESRP